MAHFLLLLVVVTVWLSSVAESSSLYFDLRDVSVWLDEPLELTCGVEGQFRHCFWETERGDVFQVEDVHEGLHPGMRASSNLTHNQCGIVVDALTERNLGRWTCRVFFTGLTLRAEKTVGKALACPDAFTQVGTGCYYVHHSSALTWDDARQFCQNLYNTADLAVMNDCHQFELVWNKILNDYKKAWYWYGASDRYQEGSWHWVIDKKAWYWIGGSDRYQEGLWHWVTGESVDMGTPYWYPGRPDANGDCLHFSDWGYFNDYKCTSLGYFICQVLYQ